MLGDLPVRKLLSLELAFLLALAPVHAMQGFGGTAGVGGKAGFGGGVSAGTALCAAVPSSGLQACYDSSVGLTCTSGCSNGNNVTQWNDQSSNANNLTDSTTGGASCCAIYEGAQINGQPSVRFNGTSNGFDIGTGINLQTASTIFVEAKTTNSTINENILAGTSLGNLAYLINGASGFEHGWLITGGSVNGCATASDTSWHQGDFTLNSSTYVCRLNESADTTNTGGLPTANETSLGWTRQYAGGFFVGDMAAVIIYNRVLSGGEITTVETALNAKYAN